MICWVTPDRRPKSDAEWPQSSAQDTVAEEKLALRISVGKDHEIPTPIQNPVPNPSHLDSALWDLTLSKVRGVAKQQRVQLEPSIKAAYREGQS